MDFLLRILSSKARLSAVLIPVIFVGAAIGYFLLTPSSQTISVLPTTTIHTTHPTTPSSTPVTTPGTRNTLPPNLTPTTAPNPFLHRPHLPKTTLPANTSALELATLNHSGVSVALGTTLALKAPGSASVALTLSPPSLATVTTVTISGKTFAALRPAAAGTAQVTARYAGHVVTFTLHISA